MTKSSWRAYVFNKLPIMASNLTYEDAIHKLNRLQSNKSSLEQIRKDIKNGKPCTNIENMEGYLARTGVTMSMLDTLSVIHVAGTKGKGSTSAMCESILRQYGFRTGFYSSPHLVAVRERIRLNGLMVTKDKFASHFHKVYDMLHKSQAYEGDMPKYFAFLTVLAFNMFLKEKVDVAVVEVGIGGIVDYTNVLRKVPVVGITALGLDHTSILGNTLTEIAQAKAGIMKRDCVAYTVKQEPEAMKVLRQVANEVQCPLNIVPDYENYAFPSEPKIILPVDAYRTNASLAVQLAHSWMKLNKMKSINQRSFTIEKLNQAKIFTRNGFKEINPVIVDEDKEMSMIRIIPKKTVVGVMKCKWPGRYQVIKKGYADFFLDGAHTKESMDICAAWFKNNKRSQKTILIFSATGDRDAENLLNPLTDLDFQKVYFVPPTAYTQTNQSHDNYYTEQSDLIAKCRSHADLWRKKCKRDDNISVAECVSNAIEDINNKNHDKTNSSVLITGSLHLVGAALSILDSSLCKD